MPFNSDLTHKVGSGLKGLKYMSSICSNINGCCDDERCYCSGIERDTSMRIEAGLIPCNSVDSDGDPEWMGTKKQWDKYQELSNE